MSAEAISIRFSPEVRQVRLHELTGYDERRVTGTNTEAALQLLDAVLVPPPIEGIRLTAEDLVAADRDRLLAALYLRTFGDRIESTLHCTGCTQPFEIHFSLKALATTLDQRSPQPSFAPVTANLFEAAEGWRFRLPTGRDERAAASGSGAIESTLAERCSVSTETTPDADVLQSAMEEVAPLLETELKASCPECGRNHVIHFDIQTYFLSSLLNEKSRLASEIHRLALSYGWSLSDVLSLTRTERRRLVELVDTETTRRRGTR